MHSQQEPPPFDGRIRSLASLLSHQTGGEHVESAFACDLLDVRARTTRPTAHHQQQQQQQQKTTAASTRQHNHCSIKRECESRFIVFQKDARSSIIEAHARACFRYRFSSCARKYECFSVYVYVLYANSIKCQC